MDRINSAIQYSGKDILNNASIVVRKPYAGLAEEMTYKIVEYFAGIHDRNGQALFMILKETPKEIEQNMKLLLRIP